MLIYSLQTRRLKLRVDPTLSTGGRSQKLLGHRTRQPEPRSDQAFVAVDFFNSSKQADIHPSTYLSIHVPTYSYTYLPNLYVTENGYS